MASNFQPSADANVFKGTIYKPEMIVFCVPDKLLLDFQSESESLANLREEEIEVGRDKTATPCYKRDLEIFDLPVDLAKNSVPENG